MLFGENNWESQDEPVPEAVGWFPSYSGEIGVGYSDNPLYGPYIQNDSSYLESSLEGFFMRQVDPQQFTYFYFYGEGKVFEELPEIQSTSILLGQFDHAYTPGGSTSTYGFRLRHVYYNQGFDFSELGLPYSIKMTSNKSEVIPYLSLELLEDLTSSIEILAGKEDFAEVTEDNRDYKISFLLKGSSGSIDWQINATGQEKKYEDRKMRNQDGSQMSDQSMSTRRKGSTLSVKKNYDGPFFVSVSSKFSWSSLQDDGGGYFDHEKISFSLSQETRLNEWNMEVEASGSRFSYDYRVVENGEKFVRKTIRINSQFTRSISKSLGYYLKLSYEQDLSNSLEFEYNSSFLSTGISWEI